MLTSGVGAPHADGDECNPSADGAKSGLMQMVLMKVTKSGGNSVPMQTVSRALHTWQWH